MIDLTTRLNRAGPDLARLSGVHAITDVTGFGLLGHLLEMCRGAGVSARVKMSSVPLVAGVLDMAEQGIVTGASARNWTSYGADVRLASDITGAQRAVLCDPQTSGGLLVACSEDAVGEVMQVFEGRGFEGASVIGNLVPREQAFVSVDA
jgi:selenide,water dikinase